MRLWSLHPKYLDRQGLLAAWREGLLAQKVMLGKTRGYQHHPQLLRFRATKDPLAYMGAYLKGLATEAEERGYQFDRSKITTRGARKKLTPLPVTRGQMSYETRHLQRKLKQRDPARHAALSRSKKIFPHAIFRIIPGEIEHWERSVKVAGRAVVRKSKSQ